MKGTQTSQPLKTMHFENRGALEQNYTIYKICSACGASLIYKYRFNDRKVNKEIWVMPKIGMFQKMEKGRNIYSGRLAKLINHL